MKVLTIALAEWRYWQRTRLGMTIVALAIVLTLASILVTSAKMNGALQEREHLQTKSEQNFLQQPDRHPHRMVHYGHYVFRTPPPLGALDPGVDAYTGTSIFLEGHRQNSAMFAAQQQSGGLTRFSSLTPAFILQVVVPLLLILVGYSCVTRERESNTLVFTLLQGVTPGSIVLGKFIALLWVGLIVLLPLIAASLMAVSQGEAMSISLAFLASYLFYVMVWCAVILLVSSLSKKNSVSFALLLSLWVLLCLLVPRIASSTASSTVVSPSKLESDFEVLAALRKLGDGHNSADPAFAKLKANLLAQYDVDDVSELPVNFRGVVAQKSEAELTEVLNQFAEKRMGEELAQAQVARSFGWLSPLIATRSLSMMLAGTNLETHHRFLRQAEALRFEFVQGLNKVHAEVLDYHHDINRHKDDVNARVSAENWQLLKNFAFAPDPAQLRLQHSALGFVQLLSWLVALFLLLILARRALQ